MGGDARVRADTAAHEIHIGPRRSQGLAISFMNEMRVASSALAAHLVSSAERLSMNRCG